MQAKNKILIAFIIIMLTASLCASASTGNTANDVNDDNLLLFKSGHINTDTADEISEQTGNHQSLAYSTQSVEDTQKYYVVQFTGPVQEKWKQEITSKGASICNYVPNNAFVFRMNENVKSQVQLLGFVKWIGEYKPSYKYVPEPADNESIYIAEAGLEPTSTYHVLLFSSDDNKKAADEITSLGGDVLSGSGNVLKVSIPASRIPDVASIEEVSWIEEYLQPTVLNDVASGIITVDTVRNTYGLKGSGQIVAVCDTGLDTGVNDNTMHDDLEGRIVDIIDASDDGSSADQNGHGTHVAGSVLGNGALSSGQYSGMATEARLVFQAVGDSSNYLDLPDNLAEIFQEAYALGARIHSNSWGTSSNGAYTTYSHQIDRFMWENPDMLILFSAGNSGKDSNGDGVIDHGSTGAPGTAKNCLTIGASENERGEYFGISPYLTWGSGSWAYNYPQNPIRNDYMASNREGIAAFSSRGPTADGRIKPDLVAPGTFIASTRSTMSSGTGWGVIDENYMYMGGTSMSTPIVAGTAALIRQYYMDVEGLSNPSAALIKATLINGAHDMTPGQYGTGTYQEISGRPDYSQGWGRVDLENSIYPQYPKTIEYFDNAEPLSTAESWTESIKVLQTSEPLRVTLVWTDYPGGVAYDKELVNDLDLIVVGPDGTYYYGNGAPDRVNNVESVELLNPDVGDYQLIVNGASVPHGPQNFALVASYESADVFPLNGSYTTNTTTAVHINLTSPSGINASSIKMTIDNSQVDHLLTDIEGGYTVENRTSQPYTEGYHNASITALTNTSYSLNYSWRFYVSAEENVITITGLEENAVIQEETLEINISNRKLCDFLYNIDNGANSTEEDTFSFNTSLNLTEGHHKITVFAEDITGNTSSIAMNFTVFLSQPVVSSPTSGTIYYLPESNFSLRGTAGIATNVSIYVNGNVTNSSCPVSGGDFHISNVPLLNGTNIVNVTSIFNSSEQEYFSPNTTVYLSLGETFDIEGDDEVTIPVPGIANTFYPIINFNITGTSANPGNVSAAVVIGQDPGNGSSLAGPAIDIRVLNDSDPGYSYQFGRNVSLELAYDTGLVGNAGKLAIAWYDPEEENWVPFRSTVNYSAHTLTTNITHLSIYVPLEDNTAPVINGLSYSSTGTSVTLTWQNSPDTDYVEIRRNGVLLTSISGSTLTDSGLTEGTTYTYSLRAIDFVGNIGELSDITATTGQTASTSSGGGGGGVGGGGGSSGESAENILFKDVLAVNTMKDTVTTFEFDNEMNDIQYVRYLSLKNSGKISTTIEVLKDTSGFAKSAAPDIIYRNINIWVGKTGYATESNIKDAAIGFRVSRMWILDNAIDLYTIRLNRYSGGLWEELLTEQTGADENYLYFEAKTPGFSPFAITGKQFALATQGGEPDALLLEMEGNTISFTLDEKDDKGIIGKHVLPGVVLGLSGITITAAYFFRRRQQN